MIKLKNNKGITLVMLIITIIAVSIIAGITIDLSIESIDQTTTTQDLSEMLMIQHAIQEIYVQYSNTNDPVLLKGDTCGTINDDGNIYYIHELDSEKLKDIGVFTQEGEMTNLNFHVVYETGYVKKVGSSTPALQSYSNWEGETTSNMIEIDQ